MVISFSTLPPAYRQVGSPARRLCRNPPFALRHAQEERLSKIFNVYGPFVVSLPNYERTCDTVSRGEGVTGLFSSLLPHKRMLPEGVVNGVERWGA